MDTAERLSSFLQTTGGWGLSAILMIVVWRLWVAGNQKDERIFGLLNRTNEMLELLQELKRQGGG